LLYKKLGHSGQQVQFWLPYSFFFDQCNRAILTFLKPCQSCFSDLMPGRTFQETP
jgi:hypothetical protein